MDDDEDASDHGSNIPSAMSENGRCSPRKKESYKQEYYSKNIPLGRTRSAESSNNYNGSEINNVLSTIKENPTLESRSSAMDENHYHFGALINRSSLQSHLVERT